MSFDLLVKGGHLPKGEVRDIGIKGDRIVAVETKLPDEAGKIIDARGQLVSPPFCDPHFHMDATLSYGMPRVNQSGTLFEGIALWGELRQIATREEMVNHALEYIDWAVSMGLLAHAPMLIQRPITYAASRRCWKSKSASNLILICSSWRSRKMVITAPRKM